MGVIVDVGGGGGLLKAIEASEETVGGPGGGGALTGRNVGLPRMMMGADGG
jgi:hypothetical protein